MKLRLLIIISFALGLYSCSKQEAPDVGTNSLFEKQEVDVESCGQISFANHIMEHANVLNLFRCTGWDKEFPNMFQAMDKVGSGNWNHIMTPIDDGLIQDKSRRDRVFSAIKELDSKDGLDDLSSVITALNETNFFDSLDLMFKCASNPKLKECGPRKQRLMSRTQIQNILKSLDAEPRTFERISRLIKATIHSLGPDAELIRKDINLFKEEKDFVALRLSVVDEFMGILLRNEIIPADKKFFPRLFLITNPATKNPWLKDWITGEGMDSTKFSSIGRYVLRDNPSLIRDVLAVNEAKNDELTCQSYSRTGAAVVVNLRECIIDIMRTMNKSDAEGIYKRLIQEINMLNVAKEFCPIIENFNKSITYYDGPKLTKASHHLDFNRFMANSLMFLQPKERMELLKFLVHVATVSSDNGNGPDMRYLLQVVSKRFSNALTETMKVVDLKAPFALEHIFTPLTRLENEDYSALGSITATAFENESSFKNLAHLWNFYESSEKNFLFRFLDRHFQGDSNFMALLHFYATMSDEMVQAGPVITGKLFKNKTDLDKTFVALEKFTSLFSGKPVLAEFDHFFTAKHILRIVKIITRGIELRQLIPLNLAASAPDSHLKSLEDAPYKFIGATGLDKQSVRNANCAKALTTKGVGLYNLVLRMPPECTAEDEFSNWLMNSMNSTNLDYALFMGGHKDNLSQAPFAC